KQALDFHLHRGCRARKITRGGAERHGLRGPREALESRGCFGKIPCADRLCGNRKSVRPCRGAPWLFASDAREKNFDFKREQTQHFVRRFRLAQGKAPKLLKIEHRVWDNRRCLGEVNVRRWSGYFAN